MEIFLLLFESVKNNLMSSELEYGMEFHYSRERTQQTTDTDGNESGVFRKTTTTDDKLKRQEMRLAPLFHAIVFQEKNRAGNIGASHQQAKKSI